MTKETPEIIVLTEKREQEIAIAIGFRFQDGKWYFPDWHPKYKGASQFDCPKFLRDNLHWLTEDFLDCWLVSNSTYYDNRYHCRSKSNNDAIGYGGGDVFHAPYQAIMNWIEDYFPL